jgi:rRNA maturation RNase YbeY
MISIKEIKPQGINFRYQKQIALKNRLLIKQMIFLIIEAEKKKHTVIDIIFCSDSYLLDINNTNLGHNYYTDTITFNLALNTKSPIVGEVYISIDRVSENAQLFKVTKANELLRVLFHSVLHLCGYQDTTNQKRNIMKKKEDYYLDLFNSARST